MPKDRAMNERECKLKECQGKPRCRTCLAMDARYATSALEAARHAIDEAIEAAEQPRTRRLGPDDEAWDDGYLNGIKACGSVVLAALASAPPPGAAPGLTIVHGPWNRTQTIYPTPAELQRDLVVILRDNIIKQLSSAESQFSTCNFGSTPMWWAFAEDLLPGATEAAPPLTDALNMTPDQMRALLSQLASELKEARALLAAAPPLLVPIGWKLVPMEATPEMVDKGGYVNSEWLNDNAPIGQARYAMPMQGVWKAMLAASPLPAPQEPLQVFSKGPWLFEETGQRFTGKELDEAAFAKYAPLYAAPAPVDPESQGSQPASPARELTDAELTVIGAEHLEAHAQFVGAGEVWVEGEVEFARAVIARDRALRGQGR